MNKSIVQLKEAITSLEVKREFESYLQEGSNLVLKKEIGFALQLFEKNSYLAKCTTESAKRAIVNVALSGLSLNPVLQQCHLIPRKNYATKEIECSLDIDYKGLVSLMDVLGIAKKINSHVIYAADKFSYDFAFDEVLNYQPYYMLGIDTKDRGKEIGVLATCILSDGETKQSIFMPIERVWEIRDTSQSYKSNPNTSLWSNGPHLSEMIKKTGIRYLVKMLPKNSKNDERFGQVINLVDEADPKTTTINVRGNEITTRPVTATSVNDVAKKGVAKVQKKNKPDAPKEEPTEDIEHEEVEIFDVSFLDELHLKDGGRTKEEYMPLYNALAGIGIDGPNEVEEAMQVLGIAHVTASEFYKNATVSEIKDVVLFIKEK